MRLRYHLDPRICGHAVASTANDIFVLEGADGDIAMPGPAHVIAGSAKLRGRGLIENQASKLFADFKKSMVTKK